MILKTYFIILGLCLLFEISIAIQGGYEVLPYYADSYNFLSCVKRRDCPVGACSIISEVFCITAAHVFCSHLDPNIPLSSNYFKSATIRKDFTIQYGGIDITFKNYRTSIVEHIHVHPAFKYLTLDNDIAIVQVSRFMIGPQVCSVQLPPRSLCMDDVQIVIAAGFGSKYIREPAQQKLRELSTMRRNDTVCQKLYPNYDSHKQLCFGTPGYGICTYDGGAPILTLDRYTLVGIGSFTSRWDCGVSFVAVNIMSYLDFICRTTGIELRN